MPQTALFAKTKEVFRYNIFGNYQQYFSILNTCVDPEGGSGPPPPLKNHKIIGFLSNTGLDPIQFTKLPSQRSILGHHAIKMAGPMMEVFSGIMILSPDTNPPPTHPTYTKKLQRDWKTVLSYQ